MTRRVLEKMDEQTNINVLDLLKLRRALDEAHAVLREEEQRCKELRQQIQNSDLWQSWQEAKYQVKLQRDKIAFLYGELYAALGGPKQRAKV